MAAVFPETVTLVNRTSKVLFVTFDGQTKALEPGENPGFPLIAVWHAKKQNVLMGSEDPNNPMSRTYLVGVKVKAGQKQKDDISPLEQSDAPQFLNREELDTAPGVKKVMLRGRKKASAFDAGVPQSDDGGVYAAGAGN